MMLMMMMMMKIWVGSGCMLSKESGISVLFVWWVYNSSGDLMLSAAVFFFRPYSAAWKQRKWVVGGVHAKTACPSTKLAYELVGEDVSGGENLRSVCVMLLFPANIMQLQQHVFSSLFSLFPLFSIHPKVIVEWKNQINHHKGNFQVTHLLPNNKDIHHHRHHNNKVIHHHHKLPIMVDTIIPTMVNHHHHNNNNHRTMAIMEENHKKKRYDLLADGRIFGQPSCGCSTLVHSLVFPFWPCARIMATRVTLQAAFHRLPSTLVSFSTRMPWGFLAIVPLLDLDWAFCIWCWSTRRYHHYRLWFHPYWSNM